jgi:hypothetical protein
MYAGTYVDVQVRTLMTITSGQTNGWSFGVTHSASWTGYYGGSVSIQSVTTAGTNTATVQNGSAPDFNKTQIRSGFAGWTQGVSIDNDDGYTIGAVTNFVQAKATYRITAPLYNGTYDTVVSFSHDIGNPRIRTIVAQSNVGHVPCANTLTFRITVSGGSGGFAALGGLVDGPGQQGGTEGAAGSNRCFRRGDATNDGVLNISDGVAILNHLFSGVTIGCEDAGDVNDDGLQQITDPIQIFNFLFLGSAAEPAPPFPNCGADPAPLDLITCLESLCDSPDTPDVDGLTNCDESERGTQPNDSDTDDDNFTDAQEVLKNGVPIPGTANFTDIAALGASPIKPDIFVEVDFFQLTGAGAHTHRPTFAQLDNVAKSFDNAPVSVTTSHGTKVNGMRLHVDAGSGVLVNLPSTSNNGNAIVFSNASTEEFMSTATITIDAKNNICNLTNMWSDFEAIRTSHFKSNPNVFHYCLYVHKIHTQLGGAGLAQGIFTDDFIVASNRPGIQTEIDLTSAEFELWQSMTFMHELGHTLGLDHGGVDALPGNKPNYRSIMCLHYLRKGADRNCNAMSDTGDDKSETTAFDERLDFSREVLDCLDETNLNENNGICRIGGSCIGACVAVNWDEDEKSNETGVQKDITNDAGTSCPQSMLRGHNDWTGGILRLDFQNSSNRVTPPTTCIACPNDTCAIPLSSGNPRPTSFCPSPSELKNL